MKKLVLLGAIVSMPIFATTNAWGLRQQSFDHFLFGLPQCQMNKEFDQFRNSLNRHIKNARGSIDQSVKVIIPENLNQYILVSSAKISGDGEYRKVEVPLLGIWNGLELKSITFYFGNENGIKSTFVNFNASVSEVKARFERDIEVGIARTKAMLARDPDMSVYEVGLGKDGSVYCDESN